jgi:mono/diheme cytochrome c family protein
MRMRLAGLRATAAALCLALGVRAAAAPPAAGGGAPSGEKLFLDACATCHLGRGGLIGATPLPELLRDPLRHGDSPQALAAVIRNGTGSPRMPAFGGVLSDAEIAALVGYIRERRATGGAARVED